MDVFKDMLKKILDAPVCQVAKILGEILQSKIELKVIDQITTLNNQNERNVEIIANGLPIIKAFVKFDSSILPKVILREILMKKYGIGTILNKNNIIVTRNIISLKNDLENKIVSRKYEINHNGTTWFTIVEKIILDNFYSNKNRGSS
ncbi:MAG: hypothetical protein ITD33_04070 [Nitrosarchaeum sp.]|nr:hypothetical protein [Nitrosarchaeum sp.]MBP0120017.1 hypothetical protein [Nitrosarchaeum sp.]